MSNCSTSSSPISDLIAPLKASSPPVLFNRVQSELSFREIQFNNNNNLLIQKLNNLSKDNHILEKQLRQVKSEYAELLFRDADNSRQLVELKDTLNSAYSEVERLRSEAELKTRECAELGLEVKQMKQGCNEKAKAEADKAEKAKVEAEKAKAEAEKARMENLKLKLDYDVVIEAATCKFRRFSQRVEVLEKNVASLKLNSSGEPRVDTAHAQETIESLGSDEKLRLVGTQAVCVATPFKENSASSFSRPKGASTLPAKEHQISAGSSKKHEGQGLVRCQGGSVVEKSGSSEPLTEKKSFSSLPICISDSDDEGEPKGLKRKLDFSEVDSRYSTKQWEYEADMVEELDKNIELCMKAVCALYKQTATEGRSNGFHDIDVFWGTVLGKFLVDGGEDGRLKKSVADLLDYNREGPSKCRTIAINHSSRIFEIYKNKEDPHFSPLS